MTGKNPTLTTRRDFLRAATTASASLALPETALASLAANQEIASESSQSAPKDRTEVAIQFPRIFTDARLSRISFPLGGIGTGGIGLGGRGNLMDWNIFNRPDVGDSPDYAFPAIWVKAGNNGPPISRVLERRLLPPYDLRPDNLGSANVPGLPRLEEATFRGSFPLASIDFHDARLPVIVRLEAFSSFRPIDADASGLPVAILSYQIENPAKEAAEVVIVWSLENPVGNGKQRHNEARTVPGMSGLMLTDPNLAPDHPLQGSFALAVLEEEGGRSSVRAYWQDNGWNMGAQRFWFDSFSKTGDLGEETSSRSPIGSVAMRQVVPAGESRHFRFLLAWHFPNRTPERCGWESPKGEEHAVLGNYYCTRFPDAWAVATYVKDNLAEIEKGTRDFAQTLQSCTLPPAVIEAASSNLSTLVSNTSVWIADGSFHGFEGCGDGKGWGFGTCTHVWNYEAATPFLYPQLSRSMRSTSFGYATDATGHMDFRHKLPLGKEHWGPAAADGQMGQIVKLYLDWKLCGDTDWLRALWPAAKRALEYAWRTGGWDDNKDGVMEGVQHNTYDIEFFGPNPLCQGWYLAALKACGEMATFLGDGALATTCQNLAAQGRRWTDANLFQGEYYVQKVQGIPKNEIADGLMMGWGAKDTLHPDFQAGPGCLVDQLLGQYLADLAGLGLILDEQHIRQTITAIYRNNYRSSMYDSPSVERAFALNDESALIMCDYSRTERPEIPFPYYSENFTGSEYAAAVLMMKYGLLKEGMECIGNIRARYDGEKANPYSEAEYGRHYARAMASWGAIPILSGFSYNAITGLLEVRPLVNSQAFRCFWSAPTGWGSFQQTSDGREASLTLEPQRGWLALKQLRLDPAIFTGSHLSASVGDRKMESQSQQDGLFAFPQEIKVEPSARLVVRM